MSDFWASNLAERLEEARSIRTHAERGAHFEDLICDMFESVVGMSVFERNVFSVGRSQEIDILVEHDNRVSGLALLPDFLLVECKNWSWPVSSMEVAWFDRKVKQRPS